MLGSIFEAIPGWLLLLLFVLTVIYCMAVSREDYWVAKGVPSVGIPLLTHVKLFYKKEAPHLIEHLRYNKAKPGFDYFGTSELGVKLLVVRDPGIIKEVLVKDFNSFPVRRMFSIPDNMQSTQRMLVFLSGEEWKSTRSLMTHAFTSGKIKAMVGLINESAANIAVNITASISENNGNFDTKKTFLFFTWDVIANCAFGTKINSGEDKDNKFAYYSKRLGFKDISIPTVLISIMFPKIAKLLKMSMFDHEALLYFEQLAEAMIEMRERDPELLKRNDFLSLLLKPDENEQESNSTTGGKKLDHITIIAQILLFFFAGSDTTASTLMYTTYLLAQSPDAQQKVLDEVDSTLKKHNNDVSYEMLAELPYLDMVVNEALRLYPPTYRLERTCTVDGTVLGNKITMNKGDMVSIPFYSIQRDPEFFPEPDKFDPERFSAANKANHTPFTFLPFGAGPRNCIAIRFALIETKIALVHLFRDFRVGVCDQTLMHDQLEFFRMNGPASLKSPIILSITTRK